MTRLKLVSIVLLITILASTFLVGCQKDDTLKNIKLIEVTHSVFYAPQYVAINKGFFEEEGLKIELINGKGADKCMTAILSGEADIGFMGPEATIYVYNSNKEDYAVNFAQLTQKDGSFLVAREPDPDFNFDKLRGKSVLGGRKGGMPYMTLEYVVKNHGLQPGVDLELRTDVQFEMMAGAFTAGEGDYVTLFEPVASQLEKEGKGYVVASIGQESGYIPYTCYSAKKTYIEKNPDIIQKFTNAIYKGMLWVQSHSVEEVADALQPHFVETEREILISLVQRYKDQDTWKPDLVLTEEGLNHMMDIMELAGELEQRADYDKVVNTEFAEESMKHIK
ncbi:sulfonate/nitrate/taurine transport system substrate-binding protein [Proteiniborus sp. DW1]|uniref:ABC transporter substrate-binding protein n=1 Tax=Proteiniborus sp. DW1 TaxID=1889883 RepID=UPI00092E1D77|nr:ABC transporter substrate-binding protein [Proteiniborus sp. DW1]SCG82528.1 sulfonate/nitrate/taurine transport system substrate-binding protein [Proteiniborus sp. DW1]